MDGEWMRAVAEEKANQAKSPSCIDFGGRRPLKHLPRADGEKSIEAAGGWLYKLTERGEVWNINEKARYES